jgi:hypothetical protein
MMKKIVLILSLAVVLLLGACNLGGAISPADQTQPPTPTLSDEELAVPIDIDDVIEIIPTEEPAEEEEEGPAPTNTPVVIQPTREIVEPTATPLPEATPVPESDDDEEEEQEEELSAESDDPAQVNGAPGWSEKFADPSAVAFIQDEDVYSKGEVVDGKLVFSAKQANIPAWRMAGTGGDALGRSYAEARITNAICHSNDDSSGLFFRVPDIKNPNQGYLFGVTCGGQYYLKMWNGKAQPGGEMFTIIAPTDNEAIRRGEDKLNRLGVLSDGKGRSILYINGQAIDEFTSPVFADGYYGIFVTASSDAGFSVSIDAASVWYNAEVPTTSFEKERTSGSEEGSGSEGKFNFANLLSDTTADPSIVLGPPTWRDYLNNTANWGSFMNDYAIWSGNPYDELVITGLKQQAAWILAKTPRIEDGAVELVIDNDNCYMWDSYGIFFRSPSMEEGDRGYLFGVTCNSYYFVWRWDGKSGRMDQLVAYTKDVDHINYGADARNRLNVVAVGDQMNFYVNGHYMTTVVDDYWTEGNFGVFVRPQYTQGFTIRLDEASYWINE